MKIRAPLARNWKNFFPTTSLRDILTNPYGHMNMHTASFSLALFCYCWTAYWMGLKRQMREDSLVHTVLEIILACNSWPAFGGPHSCTDINKGLRWFLAGGRTASLPHSCRSQDNTRPVLHREQQFHFLHSPDEVYRLIRRMGYLGLASSLLLPCHDHMAVWPREETCGAEPALLGSPLLSGDPALLGVQPCLATSPVVLCSLGQGSSKWEERAALWCPQVPSLVQRKSSKSSSLHPLAVARVKQFSHYCVTQ